MNPPHRFGGGGFSCVLRPRTESTLPPPNRPHVGRNRQIRKPFARCVAQLPTQQLTSQHGNNKEIATRNPTRRRPRTDRPHPPRRRRIVVRHPRRSGEAHRTHGKPPEPHQLVQRRPRGEPAQAHRPGLPGRQALVVCGRSVRMPLPRTGGVMNLVIAGAGAGVLIGAWS